MKSYAFIVGFVAQVERILSRNRTLKSLSDTSQLTSVYVRTPKTRAWKMAKHRKVYDILSRELP